MKLVRTNVIIGTAQQLLYPTENQFKPMSTIAETLTDVGSGVGGMLTQMGAPIATFLILLAIATGVALLFKGIFARVSQG